MRRKALQLCRSGLRRRDKRSRAKDPSAVIQRILRTAMVRGGNRHPCLLPFDNYLRQRIPVRHRPLVLGRRSRRERGDMRRPVGTRVSGMPRRQVRKLVTLNLSASPETISKSVSICKASSRGKALVAGEYTPTHRQEPENHRPTLCFRAMP